MSEKKKIPKINKVTVLYNRNQKAFDSFMESMITEYLNSDNVDKSDNGNLVGKVEIVEK